MKKILFLGGVLLAVICLYAVPLSAVHAQSLEISKICARGAPDCDFVDLLNLAKKLIDFLIILSIPLAAIAFAYAGVLFLTAAGSSSQAAKAKAIFTKVLWGFFFVLTAWLIVRTITTALLKDGTYYNPLSVAALSRDC